MKFVLTTIIYQKLTISNAIRGELQSIGVVIACFLLSLLQQHWATATAEINCRKGTRLMLTHQLSMSAVASCCDPIFNTCARVKLNGQTCIIHLTWCSAMLLIWRKKNLVCSSVSFFCCKSLGWIHTIHCRKTKSQAKNKFVSRKTYVKRSASIALIIGCGDCAWNHFKVKMSGDWLTLNKQTNKNQIKQTAETTAENEPKNEPVSVAKMSKCGLERCALDCLRHIKHRIMQFNPL